MRRTTGRGVIRRGVIRRGAAHLVVLAATVLAVAGCAAPPAAGGSLVAAGSLAASGIDLTGQTYTVGGKEFDEQLVLCKAQIAALRSVGATVIDRCGIVGAVEARRELVDGEIDMYWSYTGTGWVTDLGQTREIRDPREQYEAVRDLDLRQNRIVWTEPTPFDNTYAIATTRAVAQRTGIRTTSDWARFVGSGAPEDSLCVESEFARRPDGLPNLLRSYGVTRPYGPPAVTLLDGSLVYQSTANGTPCGFGEVFTTDGRVAGLDLVVLPDDRNFFPVYNASTSIRQAVVDRNPAVVRVSDEIARRLDDSTILGLNGQVTSQRIDPDVVARNWLEQQGLIGQ